MSKTIAPEASEGICGADPSPVYKQYRLEDGTILRFTKKEFDEVVEWYRWLDEQDKKNKAA